MSLVAALPLQRALGTPRLVRLGVLVVSLSMFLMAVAEFSVPAGLKIGADPPGTTAPNWSHGQTGSPTSVPTHPGVQTQEPQEVQSSLSQRALKMRSAHCQLIGVWLFVLALLLLGSATCLGPAVLLLLSTQAPPSQQASTQATFSAVTHGLAAGALAMHGYLLKQGRASTVNPSSWQR